MPSRGFKFNLPIWRGLKKRLERVEDLDVIDADHGVMIAKAIFCRKICG